MTDSKRSPNDVAKERNFFADLAVSQHVRHWFAVIEELLGAILARF